MARGQAHTRHVVNGVVLEKHEVGDGDYLLVVQGRYLTKVHYTPAVPPAQRWRCGCGHAARDREALFAHVVAAHVRVGATDTLTPTYLRLVGQHADPTYNQAIGQLSLRLAGA